MNGSPQKELIWMHKLGLHGPIFVKSIKYIYIYISFTTTTYYFICCPSTPNVPYILCALLLHVAARCRFVVERPFMVRWVVQPVLHDWFNKGHGMCCPVCRIVHIKEPLLLMGKSSICDCSGSPFSLSEWSFTICPTPHNQK